MLRAKLQLFLVAATLIAASLSLAGCRRQETTATPTPAAKLLLPAVGGGHSPLPTPGADNSPVKQ
jgi:uncharacterized lipoprotein YajG